MQASAVSVPDLKPLAVLSCEIDKYAKQAYEAMYDTGGELYLDDARKIVPEQLPDFYLIVGGFPC